MTLRNILYWLPRLLGAGLVLVTALLALDAFEQDGPTQVTDFLLHLMPSAVLFLVVLTGWKKPLLGAMFFGLMAAGYAYLASDHPQWIMSISLPLAVVGVLFLLSYLQEKKHLPIH